MKRTPLNRSHHDLGAKLVPFAGWEMPLSYTGVLEEHRAVRTAAGLFDVSHMGRIRVAGPEAGTLLNRVATSSVKKLGVGEMQYALACNERGGILDDLMIYRFGEEDYMVCANASNARKILDWLQTQAAGAPGVRVEDQSADLAQLAVQGPRAREAVKALTPANLDGLKPRRCLRIESKGVPFWLSRSGYTGEPGFELYPPADEAAKIWAGLISKGGAVGLKPCGLGCRDTLRLEMGYPLYGNDMDETTTPIEAALEFAVDFEKGTFIGRDAVVRMREEGPSRRLAGFELLQRGVPRKGYKVFSEGKEIGVVTSGNHSPSLNKGIGMAYLNPLFAEVGGEVLVEIRGNAVPAVVVQRPFYRRRKA